MDIHGTGINAFIIFFNLQYWCNSFEHTFVQKILVCWIQILFYNLYLTKNFKLNINEKLYCQIHFFFFIFFSFENCDQGLECSDEIWSCWMTNKIFVEKWFWYELVF